MKIEKLQAFNIKDIPGPEMIIIYLIYFNWSYTTGDRYTDFALAKLFTTKNRICGYFSRKGRITM